ncbi:MAG: Holliday junction branch migration protein RuvA [Epulopiscium sp.]|nr:Holliday junction branch migration protein RuvA [Candidatus Epulonipiscium sp.]
MIAYLKGTLEYAGVDSLIMEVNGVGYKLAVPSSTISRLPTIGNEFKIYTYLQVREDEMSLYGFISKEELNIFEKLITVSGIGPKGALNVLSTLSPKDVYMAIISEDIKSLTTVSGIGKKTAQRIILELKDKIGAVVEMDVDEFKTSSFEANSIVEDALFALTSLGYKRAEAMKVIREVYSEGMDVESIVKGSLKKLATL